MHLLVVDDSALNRDLVERALALEGASATLAADGRQAIESLKARPGAFDAVLMDVRMPVMDGLTATRLIREDLGLAGLPVIALTAGVAADQQANARAAGVDDILAKPLDLEQMACLLMKWVRRRPSATAAVTAAEPDRPAPAAAPVTGPAAAEEFPAIAGIDRERAAARLTHNRDLFLRMLEWFADQHADAADRTARDLAQGDREGAARRMHILRGGAGQLGALDIMALAGELEEAIDQGATALEGRLAALGRLIDSLMAASAPWRGTPTAPATASAAALPLEVGPLAARRDDVRRQHLKARQRFATARILIVDDDPAAIEVLEHALAGLGELDHATGGAQALAVMVNNPADLVLLDANMPDMDGFATCRVLKQDYPDLPVIFVTAFNEEGRELQALACGAVDFIHKPIKAPVVRARVSVHLQLRALTAELRTLSDRDPLTGIANRRALDKRLEQEWRRAARQHSLLGLLMIDVDHFKRYNDHYGHPHGDECLRQVARALAATLTRAGDLVARYGGEEFAVLLPGSSLEAAAALGEGVCAAVRALDIPHPDAAAAPRVTVSIGAASGTPLRLSTGQDPTAPKPPAAERAAAADSIKALLARADRAVYAAKAAGRDRVCVDDSKAPTQPC